MIPERWEALYLYASIIEKEDGKVTGELFFYYIPKGILKKNPVNVYEIPTRFNIEEKDYNKKVELLYETIKELREEFKKTEQKLWSNLTIIIKGTKFAIEFGYEDLLNDGLTSYERHIIWRYKYLGLSMDYLTKEEKLVLKKYMIDKKENSELPKEYYDAGIYIRDIKNVIGYSTESREIQNPKENIEEKNSKKNQILKF